MLSATFSRANNLICQKECPLESKSNNFQIRDCFKRERRQAIPAEKLEKQPDLKKSIKIWRFSTAAGNLLQKQSCRILLRNATAH